MVLHTRQLCLLIIKLRGLLREARLNILPGFSTHGGLPAHKSHPPPVRPGGVSEHLPHAPELMSEALNMLGSLGKPDLGVHQKRLLGGDLVLEPAALRLHAAPEHPRAGLEARGVAEQRARVRDALQRARGDARRQREVDEARARAAQRGNLGVEEARQRLVRGGGVRRRRRGLLLPEGLVEGGRRAREEGRRGPREWLVRGRGHPRRALRDGGGGRARGGGGGGGGGGDAVLVGVEDVVVVGGGGGVGERGNGGATGGRGRRGFFGIENGVDVQGVVFGENGLGRDFGGGLDDGMVVEGVVVVVVGEGGRHCGGRGEGRGEWGELCANCLLWGGGGGKVLH